MVETDVIEQEAQSAEEVKGPDKVQEEASQKSEAGSDRKNAVNDAMSARANVVMEQYNLPENYKILTDTPILELNSSYGKAFDVSDTNQGGDYYAIILPNSIPIRFETIQKLKNVYHGNFCNVVDSGFVDVGGGKYGNFAVIVEKPLGKSLSSFLQQLRKDKPELAKREAYFDEDFIANDIISPLIEVMKILAENDVSHGLININNIFIESTTLNRAKLTLKEPVSEPCGLSQYYQYETIHRAQSIPLGKGEAINQDDYFAIGVLVLHMLFGQLPGSSVEQIAFISARLEKGSYATYLGQLEVSGRMSDLLRGLLNDNEEERWGYAQLKEWIKGKRFNLIKPTIRKESVRAYEFKRVKHNNRRSLANTYYQRWDDSVEDIRAKRVNKWLELSVNKSIASDEINNIVAGTGGEKSKSRKDDDELVSKALIILDPIAPIRYRNLATHLDGLGPVLASAWHQQNQMELQTFTEILRLNLADFKAQRDVYSNKLYDRWLLQKLHNFITIRSYGFGVERCLYDLNEAYPCQSELTSKSFIIDIKQLMYFLNDNASKLKKLDPVDRHIAAFISSKMDISQEISIDATMRFKKREQKDMLIKIALLSYAQSRADIPRLNGLCGWIASRIGILAKIIKSKSLRKQFLKEIDKVAANGNVRSILDFIVEGKYFDLDNVNYTEAKSNYIALSSQYKALTDIKQRQMRSKLYYYNGLFIAKVMSVLVFIFILSMTAFK